MLVSIIIPSKSGKNQVDTLRKDINSQKISFKREIIPVWDIRPSGKARNSGAERAKGEVFVFLDDDIRFGHEKALENMIELLMSDKRIGICGVSQVIPEDANSFQRRCAKEIPHTEHPVAENVQEMGMVAGACCAIRKNVFLEIGKFNGQLLRGVDVEICYRISKKNYKIILTPGSWIYHPPPKNMQELIQLSFRNGQAVFFADKYYPELNFDVGYDKFIGQLEKKSKKFRLWRYFTNIIRSIFFFQPLAFTAKIAYAIGFCFEMIFGVKKRQ